MYNVFDINNLYLFLFIIYYDDTYGTNYFLTYIFLMVIDLSHIFSYLLYIMMKLMEQIIF
jgi:hypothetical protein